jgi:hypothetical protein
MHHTRARLAIGALAVVGVTALAGCTGGAAHVIGPGASGPSRSSAAAVTTTTVAGGATASSTTTTAPSTTSTVNPAVADQIDSELNALNNSLSQADNDLSNPNKGDQ